jgi:Domain of unknown function (DUF4160)
VVWKRCRKQAADRPNCQSNLAIEADLPAHVSSRGTSRAPRVSWGYGSTWIELTLAKRHRRAMSARGGSMGCVPTISRFYGISIAMFFGDHGPPHFHARHAQGSAKVRIDSLEVIESNLPRRQLRFVLAWAELHQDELHENWRRARAGETLQPIEPLR